MMQRLVSKTVRNGRSLRHLQYRVNSPDTPPCKIAHRAFSDRLMGFSPMAGAAPPSTTPAVGIPSAADTTTGGVWAPTSAKRDKLAELRTELKEDQKTLDDAATPDQMLDLYLADGIHLIAKTVDKLATQDAVPAALQELKTKIEAEFKNTDMDGITEPTLLTKVAVITQWIDDALLEVPASRCLKDVRDYYDPAEVSLEDIDTTIEDLVADSVGRAADQAGGVVDGDDDDLNDVRFQNAVIRLRLHLAKSALQHLQESWKTLTTVSDSDVDRAATEQQELSRQRSMLDGDKLTQCVLTFLLGTCQDRVAAIWDLQDHDSDGLLDEAEMNNVAYLAVKPVEMALTELLNDAIEAHPVRAAFPSASSESKPSGDDDNEDDEVEAPTRQGFFARRRETKIKKTLIRLFAKTTKEHFMNEVEIDHRLRCIYAWADKVHQDNSIDSVLIDSGWSGRKRYVELEPKISLAEFREVQTEHFAHLDRVGEELVKSYRENLLVQQGTGRQNRELFRDCMLFLGVVSAIDIGIAFS